MFTLREAAPYRKEGSKRAPSTVSDLVAKEGLAKSSLRVNRVGGPFGHAGGLSLKMLRERSVSPLVSHAMPRNCTNATVAVLAGPVGSSMVTELNAFYLATSKEGATKAPLSGIPGYGYLSSGKKVATKLDHPANRESREVLRTGTACVFSGARILLSLARMRPDLTTSFEAARQTRRIEIKIRRGLLESHGRGAIQSLPIDLLFASREYTTSFDVIYGHCDRFTTKEDDLVLGNKILFPRGTAAPQIELNAFLSEGRVPPGALCYPRYKISSLILALEDVELKSLHSVLHMGARQSNVKYACNRGVWCKGVLAGNIRFYPEGAAVMDWTKLTV